MNPIHQKLQILESLDTLDQAQTEKVLAYIKGLLHPGKDDLRYQKMKREAMKEIRQAFRKDRKLNGL